MGKDEIGYLGTDTVYEGKLSFKGTVRVEGRFTGEIESEGTLDRKSTRLSSSHQQ